MDTAFSNEDLKFQSEIRDFIKTNYPQELRAVSYTHLTLPTKASV